MNKYVKYKDSGIEWIGKIPEEWNIKKIKRLSVVKRGASPRPIEDPKYFDDNGEWAWVRIADVSASERYLEKTTQKLSELGASLSVKIATKKIFLSIAGTVGKPIITKIKCCIHDGFVYFPNLNINVEYLYYIFSTDLPYKGLGKWGTQLNLNTETVGGISIPIPKNKEIDEIVLYLDQQTAEIDELIAKKERLLELYEEEKTAIIDQAVTKGINPDVPMKDSGVEWLGEIPEHWEVKRLATFGSFSKGKGIPRAELKNDGFPAILYGDIYTKYNIKADIIKNFINEEITKTSVAIKTGDLLFTGSGETLEDIGKCITYLGDETVYVGGDVIILKQEKYNSLFLSYALSSNASVYQKAIMAKGQMIIHIYAANLREIVLPIPQKEEQAVIVEFVEEEISKINFKAEKTKKLIELLKEYKTALISEVVTGKIKVV